MPTSNKFRYLIHVRFDFSQLDPLGNSLTWLELYASVVIKHCSKLCLDAAGDDLMQPIFRADRKSVGRFNARISIPNRSFIAELRIVEPHWAVNMCNIEKMQLDVVVVAKVETTHNDQAATVERFDPIRKSLCPFAASLTSSRLDIRLSLYFHYSRSCRTWAKAISPEMVWTAPRFSCRKTLPMISAMRD